MILGKDFKLNALISEKIQKESEEFAQQAPLCDVEKEQAQKKEFDEWRKADKLHAEKEERVEKNYKDVVDIEGHALDKYLMKWLKYRLPLVKTGWEKVCDIDKETCPSQHKEYNELCELIELTDYILGEKWDEEYENPKKPEYDLFAMLERGEKTKDGSTILPPLSKEYSAYLKKVCKLETQKKERWLGLFTKLFWRLGW